MIERLKAKHNPDLHALWKDLPLNECSYEQSIVTGESGWRAPLNRAFKMTGCFVVDSDQSDIQYRNRPQESISLLKANNAELYQQFLKETQGNAKKAVGLLISELQDEHNGYSYGPLFRYKEYFLGKWLVLTPQVDGARAMSLEQRFLMEQLGSRYVHDPEQKPSVKVKEAVDAWYDTNSFLDLEHSNPDDIHSPSIVMDNPFGKPSWKQDYAEAIDTNAQIELVTIKEKQQPIYVPEKEYSHKIKLPKFTSENGYEY